MAAPEEGDSTWQANKNALVWTLINKLQEPDNYAVLFGKKNPGENTRGESKVSVYQRISKDLFPVLAAENATKAKNRVKSKVEDLVKKYRTNAKRLHLTGEGIASDKHVFMEDYVPATGPDHTTTAKAKNIWQEIIADFPFFPALHKFLSTRPNVIPIAVTTGVGRHGIQTLHMQPLQARRGLSQQEVGAGEGAGDVYSNHEIPIDPAILQALPIPQAPAPVTPIQPHSRGPKPSVHMSAERLEQVKANIQKVPKKPTFEDSLVELQRVSLNANINQQQAEGYRKDLADLRDQRTALLAEFQAGLWERSECQHKLKHVDAQREFIQKRLDATTSAAVPTVGPSSPRPRKRNREQSTPPLTPHRQTRHRLSNGPNTPARSSRSQCSPSPAPSQGPSRARSMDWDTQLRSDDSDLSYV